MTEEEWTTAVTALRTKHPHGRMFRITFWRQTDKIVDGRVIEAAGSMRTMVCRFGVRKNVKGVMGPRRKEIEVKNGLVTVFAMGRNGGYRTIRLSNIISVSEPENQDAQG